MIVLEKTLFLEVTRWFDAPPQRLFDAWLHESWGEWLAPRRVYCTSCIVNPKVGGRFSVGMRMPGGRDMTVSGTYLEIARPSRLVFTWQGECAGKETLVTVTFHAKHGGTELILRQEGFESEDLRSRHKAGWSGADGSLDKLAAWLGAE